MTEKSKNVKQVLVKHEERMSREQAAILLESIATKLKEEGSFTLNLGEKSQLVEPADMVKLEVELEEKNGEYEFELELEWKEGASKRQLSVE